MMSLLLNKILPLILLPTGFSLLCLLAGWLLRKWFFVLLGLLVLLVFSTPLESDFLMHTVEVGSGRVPLSEVGKSDAIVLIPLP